LLNQNTSFYYEIQGDENKQQILYIVTWQLFLLKGKQILESRRRASVW